MTAHNRQFGASGGVVSCDTSQDFGSSAPVRALPIPPPDAKLLKRCMQVGGLCVLETVQKRLNYNIILIYKRNICDTHSCVLYYCLIYF